MKRRIRRARRIACGYLVLGGSVALYRLAAFGSSGERR